MSASSQTGGDGRPDEAAHRYLELLKRCLTRLVCADAEGVDPAVRAAGRDWPPPRHAETMIGLDRLDNVQHCVTAAVGDDVPGDLIEAGVWRGGATIFMRAILAALRDPSRRVWVADSFEGVPPVDPDRYPADRGLDHFSKVPELAVGVEEVKANFSRYGLLDDRVAFLPGWFAETLPAAPIGPLAVIRIDADLYQSTTDAISALYPKLSVGGYLIVDDYNHIRACRQAVDDYRRAEGIEEQIQVVDWTAVYWRRRD